MAMKDEDILLDNILEEPPEWEFLVAALRGVSSEQLITDIGEYVELPWETDLKSDTHNVMDMQTFKDIQEEFMAAGDVTKQHRHWLESAHIYLFG